MRITILQTDIVWEDKESNLSNLESLLPKLKGTTNLVVLPEMFSTGFSMNCHQLAETNTGTTVAQLTKWAKQYNLALAGSFIAHDNNTYYNRGFIILPDDSQHFYDKRHLFRMGEEVDYFSAGSHHLIVNYGGFNIALCICYDLRFPVWSRNVGNQYDLLIYPANWPASRRKVWDTLLKARAIENMSYVCGVNRIGRDGNGLLHDGGSVVISPKGNVMTSLPDNREGYTTTEIDLDELNHFRSKFATWKDADKFKIL